MDPKKVQAIEEWRPPSDFHDLHSFLGLANYYRRFENGYSEIARPMTDLLKKTETWDWTPQCQVAFDNLKRAMVTDSVLALPDMSKPFTVETDASDFALGGVLMQDGHPVAFESRKLKDVERRYSMHEKELLAVVHCLRLWWHYLLGSPFVVKTDNTTVSHFMTQPKLTNRRSSRAGPSPPRRARQSSAVLARRWTTDDQKKLLVCAKRRGPEEITHFGMPQHSLGGTSGRRTLLCVGAEGLLLAIDAGRCRDICPHLFDLSARQDRPSEERGLLQPLPIPNTPYESVSIHYISRLPKVGDLGSIIVVVGRLSKYATFIAAPKHVTTEGTAHLFFKHVVKYWGLPKDIVSDRDSRFTGVFWTELFKLLGSKLSMSPSYHPQSDSQTKRFNYILEEYLRHFVRGTQNDWVKLLDVAQLCFNAQKSSSTNKSTFEIIIGQQPLLPHTLDSPEGVRSPLSQSFSQEWKQNVDIARSCLEKAQKRMKKYADNNRRFVEFNAGDLVMVKVPDPRLSKSSRGRDPRLMQKYVGPLPIIKRIGTVAYKIELPSWWKIHSIFHVSQLKKYSVDKEDDAHNQPSRPQLELTKTKEKLAEAILNHRVTSTTKCNHNEYLVK
ncbi:UNVERIFIED_CONTAM: Gag-Pol polyprotein [Sesamum calycinum]|uniref:Gag-Pol polyprotein n=1 Tax=Sesamum calycinum TaxID=2727403 RepID=A0AAW2SAJ7_9LAMI